jgi:sec-independent protein translocase protein TatC
VPLPRRLGFGQEASTVEHLEELRSRLLVAGGAILAGTIAGYLVHHRILRLLVATLPPRHRHLLTLTVTEPFTTSLKLSIAVGFALASPVVLWQLWAVLAPAIDPRARRSIAPLAAAATALLAAGVVFGDRVALPAALRFLTGYDNSVYDVQIRAGAYLSFALLVLAACAAVFELPIAVLGLVRVGALDSARLRRNRRRGYFVVACIGVALPGIDPVTTILETIPLLVLFEASIWASVLCERRWRSREPNPGSATAAASAS